MANSRKDNKGRVLRSGEGQRKDLMYFYRYTDMMGKRHTIYSSTLNDLRVKEDEIKKATLNGVYYYKSQLMVGELLDVYLKNASHLKEQSRINYANFTKRIKTTYFAKALIKDVNVGMAKKFIAFLHDERHLARSTVGNYKTLLKGAFQYAYDNEYILKNPFTFTLNTVIAKNNQSVKGGKKKEVKALNDEQIKNLLSYVEKSYRHSRYYDELIIMLGTGVRVAECAALTIHDVNFKENYIEVNKQLCYRKDGAYYLAPPKSEAGYRKIPMTPEVSKSIHRLWEQRSKKINYMIDGESGFLFISNRGEPYRRYCIPFHLRSIVNGYNKTHRDQLPHIYPHLLRHTFCTNLIEKGVSPEVAQYFMGHSSVNVTLDTYTHRSQDSLFSEFYDRTIAQ